MHRSRAEPRHKCIQPLGSLTSLGTPLEQEVSVPQVSGQAQALAQQWEPLAATDGSYQIVNAWSGMCIDVPNWSTADWVVLQQWSCVTGAANQEFFLQNG